MRWQPKSGVGVRETLKPSIALSSAPASAAVVIAAVDDLRRDQLAKVAVIHPPVATACWRHEQVQPVFVRKLVGFVAPLAALIATTDKRMMISPTERPAKHHQKYHQIAGMQ